MVRFLRKNWQNLAIVICAASLIPGILGVITQNTTYLAVGTVIFMASIVFALFCLLFIGAANFSQKGATKARKRPREQDELRRAAQLVAQELQENPEPLEPEPESESGE